MGYLRQEFRNIFTNIYVLLVVFGGVLLYAALYPQPYLNKVPLQQPVVVVDHDHTPTSRRLIRYADATPQVRIADQADSLMQARELLAEGKVRGILIIPRHFERDLALARSPVVGMAGDANFFLIYSSIIEGLATVVGTTGAIARIGELLVAGVPLGFAVRDWAPLQLNESPLFNVGMGYLGYVIPAVFVLILQQTLLLASGLVGTESKVRSGFSLTSASALLGARFIAMFVVYLMLAQLYMGVCFDFYGISRNASAPDLYLMIVAFLAACVTLGMFFGLLIPASEWAPPVVMVSSLPMVFTAGFIWPLEMLPEPIVWISHFFPSTHGIQGFLKLNQMGAEFSQVLNHWWSLWALAAFFFILSLAVLTRQNAAPKTEASETPSTVATKG